MTTTEFVDLVRDLVADPAQAPRLQFLLAQQTRLIVERLTDEPFSARVEFSDEELVRRVAAYEELVNPLGRAAALAGAWVPRAAAQTWPPLVGALANARDRLNGVSVWLDLYLYPALLVQYAFSIGAVAARRYDNLASLLTAPVVEDRQRWRPAMLYLHNQSVLDHRLAQRLPGLERRHTPMSDHLVEVLRPWFADALVDDRLYEREFDRYEVFAGLVYLDLESPEPRGWTPVGRYAWRGRDGGGVDEEVLNEAALAGLDWPPLMAGLFRGSVERLAEVTKAYATHLASVRGQLW
jgi:hypothetical protein